MSLESLLALGPAPLAAAAAVTAFVLVSTLTWLLGRHRERRASERGRAARAARALARRGARPAEIARRTRLSQDAVGLALHLSSGGGKETAAAPAMARQKSPRAAEAAVPRAPLARYTAPSDFLQAALSQWVRVFSPLAARRARALPLQGGVHPSVSSHRPAA
jgi:Tfp pilus assembly protein FimV